MTRLYISPTNQPNTYPNGKTTEQKECAKIAKAIGKYLGLPSMFTEKAPSDGLCGKTDEDNLGFTYKELDEYIRTGHIDDKEHQKLIDYKYKMNRFKLELMPSCENGIDVYINKQ